MKREPLLVTLFALLSTTILAGCGSSRTPISPANPTITATPDLCAPGNIESQVNNVHKHIREFDDASMLAASLPRDQLGNAIDNLQKIRREAEDESIPLCLADLKTYQIAHMNSVINTLIAFMGGSNQQSLDQGIAIARQQHDQYTLELARLLGLTVVPATAPVTPSFTVAPTP